MTVLKAIRSNPKTRSILVIVVTGKHAAKDEIQSLEMGADDYLSKPFNAGVLLARLHKLMLRRKQEMKKPEVLRFSGLEFKTGSDRVVVKGKAVKLFPKEAELLRIFLKRPNMIHSPTYLWDAIWGYPSETYSNTLRVALSCLRKKLGPEWGGRLEKHKGRGYLLDLPSV